MPLNNIETKLDEWLVKQAPYQLPTTLKESLVNYMPWIAIAVGAFALWGAFGLYGIINALSYLGVSLGSLSRTYGYVVPAAGPYVGQLWLLWVNLVVLILEGALFLLAFPALKRRDKWGWKFLFWVALLNLAYQLVDLLMTHRLFSFLSSVVVGVVGLYLIFQIRSYYTEGRAARSGRARRPARSGKSSRS